MRGFHKFGATPVLPSKRPTSPGRLLRCSLYVFVRGVHLDVGEENACTFHLTYCQRRGQAHVEHH